MNNKKSENFYVDILNDSVDSIVWFKPIFKDAANNGKVTDFKIVFANNRAAELLGKEMSDIIGKQLLKDPVNDPISSQTIFEQGLEVWLGNKIIEVTYFNTAYDKYFKVRRSKVKEGLLNVTKDVTDEERSKLEIVSLSKHQLENQKNEIESILDASLNAIFSAKAIRSEKGEIIDLTIMSINNVFTKINGRTKDQAEGEIFLKLFPGTKDVGIFQQYCDVIETGIPLKTEIQYQADGIDGWYQISAVRMNDEEIVVTFNDITEQKRIFLELKEKKDMLDKILRYSPVGISISELIKDEKGEFVDSKTIMANDAAVKASGLSKMQMFSKTALEIEPNIIHSPLFQLAIKTARTGVAFHSQYFLQATQRWLEISVSKLDDNHLINVLEDITSAKKAQVELEVLAEKLNSIINTSQAGFLIVTPVLDNFGDLVDFKFVVVNNVLAKFVDSTPDELIGQKVSDYFVIYKKNGLLEKAKYTYQTGEKQQFDFFYDGEIHKVSVNLVIKKLGEELLVSFIDVTNQKKFD